MHVMTPQTTSEQHAFIVRIWRTEPSADWRVMVKSIHDRTFHHVRDSAELLAYLDHLTEQMTSTHT